MKISHHHQLQLCRDLNKSGVEIRAKTCVFKSFLLENNGLVLNLIFSHYEVIFSHM